MKKLYSFIPILTFLAGLFSSCNIHTIPGNGDVVNKEIPIEDYDKIQISAGNSDVNAFDLETEEFNCSAAGRTHIEITANKTISAKIAGSGTIHYKGNPEITNKDIAGSGSITKVD